MIKGKISLKEKKEGSTLKNQQIRAEKVQLITQDGENIGVVSRSQALQYAEDAALDLVMIAPVGKDGVPVVKIMDYGKFLYEKKKKLIETKKHQKTIQIKEVKLSPKIGEHDYLTKMKQVVQFLKSGKRVKITLLFRGRELATKDVRGPALFEKIEQSLESFGLKDNLAHEQESELGKMWSRVYYLK